MKQSASPNDHEFIEKLSDDWKKNKDIYSIYRLLPHINFELQENEVVSLLGKPDRDTPPVDASSYGTSGSIWTIKMDPGFEGSLEILYAAHRGNRVVVINTYLNIRDK